MPGLPQTTKHFHQQLLSFAVNTSNWWKSYGYSVFGTETLLMALLLGYGADGRGEGEEELVGLQSPSIPSVRPVLSFRQESAMGTFASL